MGARSGLDEWREPTLMFGHGPQTCVRWLPVGGQKAVAAVGSGAGGDDLVCFYEVGGEEGMVCERTREIAHGGKVSKMDVADESGMLFVGSLDGNVRAIKTKAWKEDELADVMKMENIVGRAEGVVAVAAVGEKVVAAGTHGSLCVGDGDGSGGAWGRQFDEAGFRDATAVDGRGSEVVTAGSEVVVWDIRSGGRDGLRLGGGGVATSVATDACQTHVVMGGLRCGDVCVWDRRADRAPLSRIRLHAGPVWDMCVVPAAPGLFATAGHDGTVVLLDFAAAAAAHHVAEPWAAPLDHSQVRTLSTPDLLLPINSVHAHPTARIFAYASDSATVAFGLL